MIYCQELNCEFNNIEELFAALKQNENKILDVKKSNIYKSLEKGQFSPIGKSFSVSDIVKASYGFDSDYIYPVINTTRYMDAHKDVHFDGIWKKSIKDKVGKIAYVDSHEFKIRSVIAWEDDVEVFTKLIPWGLVGKNYDGDTEALIFKIKKENIQPNYKSIITAKRRVQNSVSMSYVSVKMGINSKEKDYAINKQFYDEHIDKIANKEVAEEFGYFFGVFEAKIQNEGSMVLAGSNDATAIIYDGGKNKSAAESTDQTEPVNPLKRANELLKNKKLFN